MPATLVAGHVPSRSVSSTQSDRPTTFLIGHSMCAPTLDSPPGPTAERPLPPPVRDRAVIALHTTIVALALSGYVGTGILTGSWRPQPWPSGIMALYLTGLLGLIGYAVWQGVTGRATIDTESLAAIKSRCVEEAARRPGPASAVAMRSVLPHPCTGYVYTAVTAELLASGSPGQGHVSLRTTPGWALTRRTAWHRGLVLTGHPDVGADAPSDALVGAMGDPRTPRRALSSQGNSGRRPQAATFAAGRVDGR